jgi:hypothetical protein
MARLASFLKSFVATTPAAKNKARLGVTPLEDRALASVSSASVSAGLLTIQTNNASTSVSVRQVGIQVEVKNTASGWTKKFSGVTQIKFVGGMGNDKFVNNIPSMKVEAFGMNGNDYLEGYNGDDSLIGGYGDDTLVGYGGNDKLWGSDGDDRLRGMDGNDNLMGGADNDNLIGGAGADNMWGEDGDDTLVAIDGGFVDFARGDAGRDAVWADSQAAGWDTVSGTATGDRTHYVGSFANGADLSLNGDRIADPAVRTKSDDGKVYKHAYRRYSGNPLFSSVGPKMTDIKQGAVGDCWMLATATGVARDNPIALRQNIVDFGDGTYGVRLGYNFYRVDDDLPAVTASSSALAYAQFGAENSMWVAVLEKAFAHHRTKDGVTNSYQALHFAPADEAFYAFEAKEIGWQTTDEFATGAALASKLIANANNSLTTTFAFHDNGVVGGLPVYAAHAYTVISVTKDSAGNLTQVTLRNPHGKDGKKADSNPNDALVTLSADDLVECAATLAWGRM